MNMTDSDRVTYVNDYFVSDSLTLPTISCSTQCNYHAHNAKNVSAWVFLAIFLDKTFNELIIFMVFSVLSIRERLICTGNVFLCVS